MRATDFFAFARKRHQIYLDRQAGLPAPWTDDPILATYRFTNVYRELDRTTVWFRTHVRERLADMSPAQQLMGTILFRAFNRIESMDVLFNQGVLGEQTPIGWHFLNRFENNVHADWQVPMENTIRTALPKGPWVTGAYIIKTPDGMDKLAGVLWILREAWGRVQATVAELTRPDGPGPSLERLQRLLEAYPYMGPFMAYEVVTDMAHLPLLRDAPDIMTWANAGPGAKRGLNRVHGRPLKQALNQRQACAEMRELLEVSQLTRDWPPASKDWPPLTMREIEHTLCEFDKYERVRTGEGRPRGRFA